MENVTDFINVAVRIKPAFSNDSTVSNLKVDSNNPNVLCFSDRQSFTFDHIFDGNADQATVFNDIIKPMVDKFLLGYNCTVFTYGQTGTGKTYTMGNPQNVDIENMGIINRTFKDIFKNVLNTNVEISTEVSLYEIYNEKVFDLLDNKKVPLPVKDFTVPGLKRVPVPDLAEAQELFLIASKNRKTAGTFQNAKSSRSHAIYTLFCTIRNEDSIKTSKFNFVDLAGSESVRKTGSKGNSFHEGVNINKGLLCLGQVIKALCTNQNYVPYRQATITSLLRDSLSKKNYITLIACVSSKISDTTETLQTLDFAKRVKRITSKPEAYSVVDNFFKKPAVDLTKCFTPMNTIRPVQTSTAFKTPKAVPMIASYIPSETRNYSMGITMSQEPTLSISPIVRMCVEQIEAKLPETITMLMNEAAKKMLRRSTRISALRRNCSEVTSDQYDENTVVLKKKRRTDNQENDVLKDITVESTDSADNAKPINNNKDYENLTEKDGNNSLFLFKDLAKPLVNVSKSSSKRVDLIQTTSSPNVTAEYSKFTEKLEQNQQLNEVFDGPTSFALAPAPRRSIRLITKNSNKTPETSCDSSSRRTKTKRRSVQDKVESKKIKDMRQKHRLGHVLKILNNGTSADDTKAINNKDYENLTENNKNNSSFLFKDIPKTLVDVSKSRSRRITNFAEKLEQKQQLNEVFNSPISFAPTPRRSIRLITKNSNKTPESSCDGSNRRTKIKRRSVQEDEVESKKIKGLGQERHIDHVLKILNNGTLKNLSSLQTIGAKTAEQILLYRELRGKFETIQEVKNVLIRGKAYKRFMDANFLL